MGALWKDTNPLARRVITTPAAGIALSEAPATAEVQALVDAGSWTDPSIVIRTTLGYDHVFNNYLEGGSQVVRFDGIDRPQTIPATLPNPADFRPSTGDPARDGSVYETIDGRYIVNQAGTWVPTELDVVYRGSGGGGGSSEINDEFNYNTGGTLPANSWGHVDGQLYFNPGADYVLAATHAQRITDGLTVPGTSTSYNVETQVLANLPANTWTAFPTFGTIATVNDYEVRTAADVVNTDAYSYRKAGASYEMFSLVAETNLQIQAEGI